MSPTKNKKTEGFSAEEKAAMRARAKELKAAAQGEEAILAALEGHVARRPRPRRADPRDRQEDGAGAHAEDVVRDARLRDKNGKVVVFFRNAEKFKERYAMLGFQDNANIDDGTMWPVAFALTTKLTKADETKIAKLVKQAVS